jgi:hypothetical protein
MHCTTQAPNLASNHMSFLWEENSVMMVRSHRGRSEEGRGRGGRVSKILEPFSK